MMRAMASGDWRLPCASLTFRAISGRSGTSYGSSMPASTQHRDVVDVIEKSHGFCGTPCWKFAWCTDRVREEANKNDCICQILTPGLQSLSLRGLQYAITCEAFNLPRAGQFIQALWISALTNFKGDLQHQVEEVSLP